MPRVGFEPTIPVLEETEKKFHVFELAASETGAVLALSKKIKRHSI
jgi:hypothetical protein